MANRLKMAKVHSIQTLHAAGWSQRRIARVLGVDRGTVARYVQAARAVEQNQPNLPTGPPDDQDQPNPPTGSGGASGGQNQPNPPAGSGPASRCAPLREVIGAWLERGLSAQRIWQDLKAEHAFSGGYDSVKRFCRRLQGSAAPPFRRMECAAGEEAQVDFGRGAPVLAPAEPGLKGDASSGSRRGRRRYRRPHVLRVVLSHSRKGYSEVVERQTTDNFIRCLENAFQHFGGVPRMLVIDNLKAAVTKADWFDPELNPKLQAFAEHCGTVIVPTRPYTPRHEGKVERGVDYVQENALKGRTFDSLADQNRYLAEWEAAVADTRIHGTTRQQVGRVFEQIERPALRPLPATRFPCFQEGQRIVNRDGHVEVAKAYYSAPPEFLGRKVWIRWDSQVVRLFDPQFKQIAIHARREPGRFATDQRHIAPEKRGGLERGAVWWLRKAQAIGPEAGRWAETLLAQRGIHALRAVMGLVSLTQRHASGAVEQACASARAHAAWRLRDLRNLLKRQAPPQQERFEFITEHPLIRSLSDYGRLVRSAFEELHA